MLLSSLGEVDFAWAGFIFQTFGIVAESAPLVLIQWLLEANQENTQQHPQRTTHIDDETGLASSSNSNNNSDHESDAEDEGATVGCHSDGDSWSAIPTHGHGAVEASRADNGRERDEEGGDIVRMSSLSLVYYYDPTWTLLNGLMALIFEAPEFDR